MKPLIYGAIASALLCTPALAQQGGQNNNNGNNAFGAQGGATFQLPPSIQSVVSIDAHNMVIIASEGDQPGQVRYTPRIIQHVYSGGIARVFGGFSVPTEQFVSPGFGNSGGFNNNNGNNGNNNGNVAGFGGNNGNDGFGGNQNGGGFQNNGGFSGGFQNGTLRGNGFNTLSRNDIINARVRTR